MALSTGVTFTVNGREVTCQVEPRRSLLDCLREDLGLSGTHVGCEHGVCGCCNVWVDGDLVRSCLTFAYQVEAASVVTIEGIEAPDGSLSRLQQAFCDHHALQCGYCTPGMIMALEDLFARSPRPTDEELTDTVSGNLCRCTGYQQILDAARSVASTVGSKAAADGRDGARPLTGLPAGGDGHTAGRHAS